MTVTKTGQRGGGRGWPLRWPGLFAVPIVWLTLWSSPSGAQQPATPAADASPATPQSPAAASQPAPEKAPPLPADAANRYIIGPNDGLLVTVWKEQNLSGSLAVRPDGMVSLPLVGDIPASGKTPMALSEEITARLKKFINDPLVTVSVVSVNSKHIFLIGEVQHVGELTLVPGMTLLQAISAAGGLTPYANAKRIYILRGEKGNQQKIPFNYKKALKDGNQQGIDLVSGDTIVVP